MKQLGVKTEDMGAEEVVVKTKGKELVFKDPKLTKIDAKGQEMFQLQGKFEEREAETGPDQEDIELVAEKASVSEERAEEVLKKKDDISEAIMELKE